MDDVSGGEITGMSGDGFSLHLTMYYILVSTKIETKIAKTN